MRHRVALLAVLAFAVIAQGASTPLTRSAAALQSVPGAEVEVLGSGAGLYLYRFAFDGDEGENIDQQRIEEPMLVHVLGGSFVFYIPEAAGGTISFSVTAEALEASAAAGQPPVFAVNSTDCDLPLEGDELRPCEFADTPSETELACDPSPAENQRFDCAVSDEVGILVRPGTTLILPGPTECMVCKLNIDAGELEVAVGAPPEDFGWYRAVNDQSAASSKRAPVVAQPPTVLIDPCNGLVR